MKRIRKNAEKIVEKLRKAGHIAYFAGGCVRDMEMGIEPKDYDIATSALPDNVISLFSKTLEVGAKFGVVVVILEGHKFEVATFRTDTSYSDGRRPDSVIFSSPEEDVKRRDFTINGLLYDPFEKKILDFVGGREDIKRGIVRSIGDPFKRFEEDRLRMLRAVRFSSQLNFEIEPGTREAIIKLAPKINSVSVERITAELIKMFTGENADKALETLQNTGLLKEILPEIENLKGVAQPDKFHPEGDVFEHTKKMLGLLKNQDETLAFAVLLHDVGKPATFRITDRIRFNNHDVVGSEIADKILRRLKFSNETRKNVVDIVRNHMRFMHVKKMKESTLKKLMRRTTFKTEMQLHKLDCLASHGSLEMYKFLKKKANELPPEQIKPIPLIKGADLVKIGFQPSPVFSKILSKVEELQLDGKLLSKDEAIEWVKANFSTSKKNA